MQACHTLAVHAQSHMGQLKSSLSHIIVKSIVQNGVWHD